MRNAQSGEIGSCLYVVPEYISTNNTTWIYNDDNHICQGDTIALNIKPRKTKIGSDCDCLCCCVDGVTYKLNGRKVEGRFNG